MFYVKNINEIKNCLKPDTFSLDFDNPTSKIY